MTDTKPAVPARRRGRDRWGLRRVRAGRVRGQIRDIRRSFEVGVFGTITVIDFDLFIDDGLPPVPVRMSGTSFSDEPHEGHVVEVRDPDPTQRPIAPRQLYYPPGYEHEVISFFPGRDDPSALRERLRGVLVVLGPIAFALFMLGLFFAFYG